MSFNQKMETYFIKNFKNKVLSWKKEKEEEDKEESTQIETEVINDDENYSESGVEGAPSHFNTIESVIPPAHQITSTNVRLYSSIVKDYGLAYDEVIFQDRVAYETLIRFHPPKLIKKLIEMKLIERRQGRVMKLNGRIFVCHCCCRFFGDKDGALIYDKYKRAIYCNEQCFNNMSVSVSHLMN